MARSAIMIFLVLCLAGCAMPVEIIRPPLPPIAHPKSSPERHIEPAADEPKFTSREWWVLENARVGKAMMICRGC